MQHLVRVKTASIKIGFPILQSVWGKWLFLYIKVASLVEVYKYKKIFKAKMAGFIYVNIIFINIFLICLNNVFFSKIINLKLITCV